MFEQDRIWGSVNIPYDELENLMGKPARTEYPLYFTVTGAKSMVVCRDLWRMGYHAVDLAGGMLNYRKYIDREAASALRIET